MELTSEAIRIALSHAPINCEVTDCEMCKTFSRLMRDDFARLDAGLPSKLADWLTL